MFPSLRRNFEAASSPLLIHETKIIGRVFPDQVNPVSALSFRSVTVLPGSQLRASKPLVGDGGRLSMRSATISALCVLLLLICSPGPVAGQSNPPSTPSPPSQVPPATTKFPESQGVTEAKTLGTNSIDEP